MSLASIAADFVRVESGRLLMPMSNKKSVVRFRCDSDGCTGCPVCRSSTVDKSKDAELKRSTQKHGSLERDLQLKKEASKKTLETMLRLLSPGVADADFVNAVSVMRLLTVKDTDVLISLASCFPATMRTLYWNGLVPAYVGTRLA